MGRSDEWRETGITVKLSHNASSLLFYFQCQGSCFVVFGSDETAKKFLETPDVKYGDVALLREYRCATFHTLTRY